MKVIYSRGAIKIYRVGRWCYNRRLYTLASALTVLNRLVYATVMPSSAEIGPGVTFGYGGLGIVVHSHARIGRNSHICQNVTIGRAPGRSGVPNIGARVYVGPGAVLSGDISVGDDCVIGANSVVLIDVPAGMLAAGVPARVIGPAPPLLEQPE